MTQLVLEAGMKTGRIPMELAASGKFGPFKPESDRTVRIADVKMNPFLEEMKKAWMWHELAIDNGVVYDQETYRRLLEGLTHPYSARDVEDFSIVLAGFQGGEFFPTKAGLCLSALINNGDEDDYVVHTTAFAEPIISIGYRNTKNITVEGNAGHYVGDEMEAGKIIVNGNVGDDVGWYMKGGSITVVGDAGYSVGGHMSDGELRINGSFKEISQNFLSGKIFHRGELIVNK